MYSAVFALTVIFGIAVVNLFLGFSAALLVGRGPRRWADLDGIITIRRFSPALVFSRPRSAAHVAVVTMSAASPAQAETAADPAPAASPDRVARRAVSRTTEPPPSADTGAGSSAAAGVSTAPPAAVPSPPKKLVLARPATARAVDDRPSDEVLAEQLARWKDDEQHEEAPALTMLRVVRPDAEQSGGATGALLRAVRKLIVSQLRRDRTVLIFEPGEFVWLADDMPAEDAMMPAERIRQIIGKTEYRYDGQPLEVGVATAVVAVREEDDTAALLDRLRVTVQVGVDAESFVAVNTDGAPKPFEPLELEIAESVEILDE